jgi:hypothetical protein
MQSTVIADVLTNAILKEDAGTSPRFTRRQAAISERAIYAFADPDILAQS